MGNFRASDTGGGVHISSRKSVRRLIYMSSAQAMLGKELTHIYTEVSSLGSRRSVTSSFLFQDDWNDGAVKALEENAGSIAPITLYAATKVLAERAVISFAKQHEGKIDWDITRMVPAFVRLILPGCACSNLCIS